MERVPRIQELNRQLSQINAEMLPFTTPHSADNPKEWKQADLDHYLTLHKRQAEIIIELSKLEGGMP